MQAYFITSPGTDAGKTLVVTALCWQFRQQGKKVTALKPVISGYRDGDRGSDTALILESLGLDASDALIKTVSPWRFAAPLAPAMAAKREGGRIDINQVAKFCADHAALQSDLVLAEGAGGVMTPLNERHTTLDLMAALGWPAILVTGSYLGSLSHTLTAVEALKCRQVPLSAVVVSESPNAPLPMKETVDLLEKFMPPGTALVKVPRVPAGEKPWERMPPIHWICEP